jgi:tetratricopeptide (TPR) repeat protein
VKAIANKDYPQALDFLDRVVTMAPDYAEGWNKRATVYYLTDDYSKAMADLKHVLVIEPRHFGALTGIGSILRDTGQDKPALEAYQQALALDPHLDEVKKAVNDLEKETGEKDI